MFTYTATEGTDSRMGVNAGISMTSARTATIELKNGDWLIISHDESDIRLKNAVDINEDGMVNVTDLAALKTGFGRIAG